MKEKKKFLKYRSWRYAIATALVLLSLLGVSVAFIVRVYFTTETACYDALKVETDNAITELEANFRNDRVMLRVIAGMIGNSSDVDSIEVSGYLTNYDYNSLITQVGILLPDNKIITSRGYRGNTDSSLSFTEEYLKGEHINSSKSFKNNSDSTIVRNFVPIRKDGICTGMLFSSSNASNISKAWLPNVYDKKGCCYIVNRKTGEIIINSASDGIENIKDISFEQTSKDYTKEGTVNAILEGRKGYSVFKSASYSEKLFMCYLPFSIEDWEMVVFVPESSVFSNVAPVRTGIYMLIAVSVVILLIYGLWLIREIRASIAEAEQKANIDVLTGLQNRNRYEAYLKKLESSNEKITCLFIDANGLHELNNSKGHFAGDQMLRFIADTLKVLFSTDNIYRIGGDEFVVFKTLDSSEELNKALAEFNEALHRNDYHAAVGSCTYNEGMSVDELIVSAEKNMYENKHKYYEQIGKAMRS